LLEKYKAGFQGLVLLADDVDRFRHSNMAVSLVAIEQRLSDLFTAHQFEPYLKIDAAILGLVDDAQSDHHTFDERLSLSEIVFRTERNVVLAAIERYNGQIAPAAKALGLSRQGLYKKLKKLDIVTHT
jgi:transcriptional regulator of acetoin/glycerol metabolism